MHLIEYYEGDGILHRLDPRVKILLLLLMTIAIFIVKSFWVISVIFISVALLWRNAGLPLGKFKIYIRFLLGLFVIIIILQGLFRGGATVLLKPIIPYFIPVIGGSGSMTLEGLFFGLLISFRLLTLIILMPLITMTTPVHFFVLGLVKLGMSYKIAYTMTTTINIIPGLQTQARAIMDAQRLRGFTTFEDAGWVSKIKAYPALVLPLVISAMRNAQLMGVAMDARAFGISSQRTYMEDIKMRSMDWAIAALVVVYVIVLLAVNFFAA